jgi:transcriptional regulator with XRE-family HTH domain
MTQDVVVSPQTNHKPFNELVADKIRGRMAEQHKRQVDLAEVLGMTQQAVSKKLRGRSVWDVNELHAVADWLDTPISELLNAAVSTFRSSGSEGAPMNPRYVGDIEGFTWEVAS